MKQYFLFASVIILSFCSFCNNEEEKPKNEVLDFLVEGDWIHTAYQTDPNKDGVFEDAALPCQIGDVWRFNSDNSFQWRDELPYCDEDVDSVAVFKGTWALQNNDTEIHLELAGGWYILDLHIQDINSNKLELRQYNDPGSSSPEEERFSFVR